MDKKDQVSKARRYSACHVLFLRTILLFITIWYFSSTATALAAFPPTLKPNPLAEEWVVEQIAAGKIADLEERFPDEADRVLSADFLEKLLTNSLKDVEVQRQGIRIKHAVLIEPIDLENAEIPHETWLHDCRFEDELNLSKSLFRKDLSFDGSSFNAAYFNRMKADGSTFFNRVIFAGPVDFTLAEIAVSLMADKAQFNNSEQEADFNSMKVGHSAFFRRAFFAGPVDFISADIGSRFDADDAQFTNTERPANFNSMKVGDIAFFNKAVFAGPVDFISADIGSQFDADDAQFTNTERPANFNSMKVGRTAFFDRVVFAGPVDFIGADIGSCFVADEAQFTHTEQEADFNSMKVGRTAFFDRVVFAGPVDFINADIGSQFVADDAQFTNTEQPANFDGMKVGDTAFFNKAVFAGPVDFKLAEIAVNLVADEAQFNNSEQKADFNSLKVGHTAFFNKAVFAGSVDFISADIGSCFVADDARFTHTEQPANFDRMKVGDIAFFRKAVFAGPVDFALAEIAVNFDADEAQFNNSEQKANFNSMKVGHSAFFRKVVFAGPVSMADGTFLDLLIQGSKESSFVSPHLDLSRTLVKRQLQIEDLKLQDLVATSLRVEGPTSLNRLTIEGTANLEHSSFLMLTLQEVSWPEISKAFRLDGMTYQRISASTESTADSWKNLLELANRSAYSAHTYKNLEAFFQRQGHPERADEVFISRKRRERAEVLPRYSVSWWWNLFLEIFVLYGRSPARAFLWSALFVVIGCLIFRRREGMELQGEIKSQEEENASRDYNALWYSLDLFLPFIDLQTASAWAPRPERRFARNYMRLHTIFGWLLIPIALLAVTGIIK